MGAVAAGDADSVRLLLDKGADANAAPAMSGEGFIFGGGRTPLMWAAFRGDNALLKLLLARGAKVDGFTLAGTALLALHLEKRPATPATDAWAWNLPRPPIQSSALTSTALSFRV